MSLAAGVLAAVVSAPLMVATDHARDPLTAFMAPLTALVRRLAPWAYELSPVHLRFILLGLTLPVVGWAGRHFYTRAWAAFRHHSADMNTLIAVGTGAAFLYQPRRHGGRPIGSLARGIEPHVYYEAVVWIIALVLLGNLLEARAKGRTSGAHPPADRASAHHRPGASATGAERRSRSPSCGAATRSSCGRARPFPPTAWFSRASSHVDESMLTGEPVPVRKGAGRPRRRRHAQPERRASAFRVDRAGQPTACSPGSSGWCSRPRDRTAPIQRLADRICAVFVPVVISLAIATFVLWFDFGPDAGLPPRAWSPR